MLATALVQIKSFRIGKRIGEGGFSTVWAAVRRVDDVPIAVKIGADATSGLVERFRREAAALRQVGPPHVPRFHDEGRLEDGRPWIAMERLFGQTLEEALAGQPGPLPPARVFGLADGLLAALDAAHVLGVVHRDVKPENVFLAAPGMRIVLFDFGLTTAVAGSSTELTRSGAVVGTPYYMAPEQIRGEASVDARADVYACGVMIYRLLTARLPFEGDTRAVEHGHLTQRPPRPRRFAAMSPALEALVLACLAKHPGRRPADAGALRLALATASVAERMPDSERPHAPATILGSGTQPVVLLLADTRAPMPAIVAAITRRRGIVARQRGSRYLGVFSSQDVDRPPLAAYAAAQEIVRRLGGRAALGLSNVAIRPSGRGSMLVSGPAVDRPETWAPPEPWSGLVVGEALAEALAELDPASPASASPLGSRSSEASTGSSGGHPPLVGREATLEALRASAAPALAGECPGLFMIRGDVGVGKTRIALEAALITASCRPDARVVVLRPGPHEDVPPETAMLLRLAINAPAEAPSDVEAFCWAQLGDVVGAETWPSVATALGWRPRGGAPLRRDLVRAIATGLRRRARSQPMVVILDDAHLADEVVLEAIEAATLDGEGLALWALVTAPPPFEDLRPQWGARTQRFVRATLEPLDEVAAAALAAELLWPAEYPPAAVLRRLAQWSGGNARCLAEVVRALKRAGVVQRRPGTETHHVATAELEKLTASPAWQWVATRSLAALPPDLASLARLCAVLGASFTCEELEWVEDAADREGSAGTTVDAELGLRALVERGLLRQAGSDRYAFGTRMIRHAIVEMIDPVHRRSAHAHALAYWRARVAADGATPDRLEPLAMHAVAVEAWEEAVDAHLRLGDLALAVHRHVEADQHFTAALDLARGPREKIRALLGRGRCRYRLHAPRAAAEDLVVARELAADLGDNVIVAETLLEEATALDWAEDFAGSAERVAEASALLSRLAAPRLAACLWIAEARTAMRQGEMAGAVQLLQRALEGAGVELEYDARIVALVLLPVALVFSGQLAEAEARFQEVIDRATAVEDWPHVGQSYINRALLWGERKELSRARADMSRTLDLAREIGNPYLERQATLNVAEMLHWEGRHEEALALARRALLLDQRFLGRPATESSLLLARILLAGDSHEAAAQIVDGIVASHPLDTLTPSPRAFLRMLQRVLGDLPVALEHAPRAEWEELVADARGKVLLTELLELLYWRARTAVRGGRKDEADAAFAEAGPLLRESPAWQPRFDAHRPRASSTLA